MKWLLAAATFYAAIFVAIWSWVRLPEVAPLEGAARRELLSALRRGTPAPDCGPLIVQLYDGGRPRLRIEARSLDEAVRQFAAHRGEPGVLVVNLVRARGRLPGGMFDRSPTLFALSLVPGVDGLSLQLDGREALLLPDDLRRAGALGGEHPLPQLDLDVGIDVGRTVSLALERLESGSGRYESSPHRWQRLRIESFAEDDAPPPPVTRQALLDAAHAAGEYLVHHLDGEGRYDYLYDPIADASERGEYSLTRHAGATYFLAQLAGNPAFAEPAARALEYLQRQRRARGSVGEADERVVGLGAAALSLAAAAQFRASTGDARFDPWITELAGFLRYMQRDDGDFRHHYRPEGDVRDEHTRAPYYSGEAALALALAGDHAAAERAVDYLIGPNYDFFLGQFLYAEDHWTCLAAGVLADRLQPEKLRRYARFCDGFAAFLRRMQYQPDDGVRPGYLGAYGVGSILPPHVTPVGSRSECAVSVYQLDQKAGLPTEDVRQQLLASMQFLLARQMTAQLWRFSNPSQARGGFPQSDANDTVRIDGVQHVGSALLRAASVIQ